MLGKKISFFVVVVVALPLENYCGDSYWTSHRVLSVLMQWLWCKLFYLDFTLGLLELDFAEVSFDLTLVCITGIRKNPIHPKVFGAPAN